MVSLMPSPLGQLLRIAAFARIKAINNVLIPTALAGGNRARLHQLHHFIGLGAIAHKVAQTSNGSNSLLVNVIQHGFKGGEIDV